MGRMRASSGADARLCFTPRPLGPLRDIAQQAGADLLALLDTEAPRASIFSAFLGELQSGRPTDDRRA